MNPINTWGEKINRHLSEENQYMTYQHIKNSLCYIILGKPKSRQIYHHITLRMTHNENSGNKPCYQGYGEK